MGVVRSLYLSVTVVDCPGVSRIGSCGPAEIDQAAVLLNVSDEIDIAASPVSVSVSVSVLCWTSPIVELGKRMFVNSTLLEPGRAYGSVTVSVDVVGALGAAVTLLMMATTFVKSYPAGALYSVEVITYELGMTVPLAVSLGKKRNLRGSVASQVFSASSE